MTGYHKVVYSDPITLALYANPIFRSPDIVTFPLKLLCTLPLLWPLIFTPVAHAQSADSGAADVATKPAPISAEQAMQQVREELAATERRWYGITRARWSYPQKFSVGIGAMFTEQRKDADCADPCTLYGWHFEVEPGLYGVQGSVGWGKLVGETGRTEHLMHTAYLGWALRGVVMRTWGNSPLTPTDQTLAGIEGNFSLLRLNYSIGVLRSLSSNSSRDVIFTAGIGWGF